jgi:hypothetical protein
MTQQNLHNGIPDDVLDLLARKALNQLSREQELWLEEWVLANPGIEGECDDFVDRIKKAHLLHQADSIDSISAYRRFMDAIASPPPKRKLVYYVVRYAALVLVFFALGWYLVTLLSEKQENSVSETPLPERHNKALLVLSNGKQMLLDQSGQTTLREEGDVIITNKPGEVLTYDPAETTPDDRVMNNLIVPAGGRYQVQLSDGTHVWMNAVSQMEYPIAFGKEERRIFLRGEAYLEVTEDRLRPFIIETNGYEIKVIGTAFNLSTYVEDDFIETTLVNGMVEVKGRDGKITAISPGQSLKIVHEDQSAVLEDVDPRFFISWKEGVLHFNKVKLVELTTKLERWYDVRIEFQSPEAQELIYSGAMENSRKLEFLLELIEQTADVKFEIEDDRVLVK